MDILLWLAARYSDETKEMTPDGFYPGRPEFRVTVLGLGAQIQSAFDLNRIAVALEEANEIARARVKLQVDGRIGS
jgi:hypothetical protein